MKKIILAIALSLVTMTVSADRLYTFFAACAPDENGNNRIHENLVKGCTADYPNESVNVCVAAQQGGIAVLLGALTEAAAVMSEEGKKYFIMDMRDAVSDSPFSNGFPDLFYNFEKVENVRTEWLVLD